MHKRWLKSVSAVMALCIPLSAMAQNPASPPQQTAAPLTIAAASWQSGDYWANFEHQLLVDFANLARYRAANLQLGPATAGRVVFIGDSITDGWKLDNSFPGKPYINRGIGGQTTSQILLRFRQDAIDLHPRVVLILAGTNDIAGNTGPTTPAQIEGNLESMAQLASANHIKVVLCSVLPAVYYFWHPQVANPTGRIVALNGWLKAYAARHHDIYVDYYAALKDSAGGFRPGLSKDGVHPLPAGYAIMAPLAQAAIDKALK
ncbi:MAG TPA: SGNH/GDSL hydrolase family protein [Steroidobacteraceae bacterium]|jgi:lysophospholipase L1-like esterase